MAHPAELIFTTAAAAALAWSRNFRADEKALKDAWNAFEGEVTAELGAVPGTERRRLITYGDRVIGVERSDAEYEARAGYATQFPGWREHPKLDTLVPKLNSKVGKAWQARIDALPYAPLRNELEKIGSPSRVFTDHMMYTPGFTQDTDADGDATALYVSWGSAACRDDVLAFQAKLPDVEWSELPLSKWYARLEALDAAA